MVYRVPARPCSIVEPPSLGGSRHFSPIYRTESIAFRTLECQSPRCFATIFSREITKNRYFCESMADKKSDKDGSVPLPMSVSQVVYGYLTYLARHTTLGQKETDVARFLLTERINEMVRTKEHEKLKPPS